MRIVIFFFSAISLFYGEILAQTPVFQWAKGVGGTQLGSQSEYANDIKIDINGNLYVTGNFEGSVDFDPGAGVNNQTSNGISDAFILKLDASGNLIWVRSFGGSENDYSFAISLDSLGNCYVTGSFKSIVDFDPGIGVYNITSAGLDDAFVIKLDDAGNFIWVNTFAGPGISTGKDIFQNELGYIYITGQFTLTNDFDPGTSTAVITSNGSSDGFVCKLDLSGNFQWAKSIGGINSDAILTGAVDKFDNVYMTGAFSDVVDFDPGTGTTNIGAAGYNDVFISKWNASGNFIWAKNIGGPGSDMGRGITVDSNCSVITTGYFMSTADFDPGFNTYGLTSYGGWDIFISKLDSNGNFLMAGSVGGINDDIGNAIVVDHENSIYVTGGFNNTADFDPGSAGYILISSGLREIFMMKLDSTGDFVWAKKMGGNDFDESTAIATDGAGNIYTTGTFSGTADFNPPYAANLYASGDEDFFVAKYEQQLLNIVDEEPIQGFEIFPNPVMNQFTISISDNKNGLLSDASSPINFSLTEISGKIIRNEIIQNTSDITVNVHDLTPGIYFVRLERNGFIQVKKIVVLPCRI